MLRTAFGVVCRVNAAVSCRLAPEKKRVHTHVPMPGHINAISRESAQKRDYHARAHTHTHTHTHTHEDDMAHGEQADAV